jgi:LysM repeat protein
MPTDLDTAAEPAAGVAAPIDDGQATAAPAFEHWLPLVGPDDRDDEEDDAEASVPATTDLDPVPVVPALETWLPLLEDRSQNPEVCPFFRAVVADGRLGPPIESTHPANRCAALRQAAPQSLRQQQLVCLTSGHINCPRYLRGALVMSEPALAPARPRSGPTPATLSALVALVLAFSASVAFVLAKGGLTLQAAALASTAPSAAAVALATPSPTPAPLPSPTASPLVSASPSIAPSATPTATPSVTPTPTATAVASRTPQPTSSRYALLTACPNKPRCWIYTVRSGDNLFSIAHYFGVPLSTVRRLNPWTRTQALRAGKQLVLPPPTR